MILLPAIHKVKYRKTHSSRCVSCVSEID